MNSCRNKKPYDIDDCKFYHHPTLHDDGADKVLYSVNANTDNGEQRVSIKCLLPLMAIKSNDHVISVPVGQWRNNIFDNIQEGQAG